MRNFIILLLVLGLIGVGVQMKRKHSAVAPSADDLYEGYWEMRMNVKIANRDIDYVVVGEKPLKSECGEGTPKVEIPAMCKGQIQCTVKQIECTTQVSPRYVNMLQKKPVSLHYLHFNYARTEPVRSAVMVAWGLTEAESKMVCEAMAKDPKIQAGNAQCI